MNQRLPTSVHEANVSSTAGPLVNEDLEVPSFLRKHLRDRR